MCKYFFQKKFDQYFLKDKNIAKKIVKCLSFKNYDTVVEIGPGLGILTRYLLTPYHKVLLIEIDKALIFFLKKFLEIPRDQIIHGDFLKWNPEEINLQNFAVIGNFPYNISSKILFHILKYYKYIPECIGMFQKEVAKRIVSPKGNKTYGILSVLVQTFYDVKYLFTVNKHVFYPIPNVQSAVIYLKRKKIKKNLNKNLLFQCVKVAFNQRRKILKNSLHNFIKKNTIPYEYEIPFLNKRAEQLSVIDFIQLTKEIEKRK
ncbi:16S rRNA (adenine(1518)-N(6)/adenine(1519)-N(6))-dimethyltransferase RsmA [Blattabacterium cuenoti]|uniref:16S rRNA (adenine(1518)-N(6)/adenine(1519)-N(6))- dimethyltransferase RsmA n=1 Tax=Blattabacterium cuenoti TaxID=1653831 RepID=UPI00163BB1BC|nr:16S rRNA (adenine(1518)-N(6)/adenine(1519)-N(6))-dimethyltransferase RsmA [Blattabacterium cuenoti]